MNLHPRFARRLGAVLSAVGLASALSVMTPLVPALDRALAQSSVRDAQAEQFVQSESQNALAILGDHDLSIAQKAHDFRAFVDRVGDVPKVTNFVLGKYARVITPDQHARFASVFRDYASSIYEHRLGEYRGETFRVTGSVIRKPGDVIVSSVVSGGHLDKPIPVTWRVLAGAGGWKVVDVQVSGIWLAITEQQDFVSTIDNAHGNIDVLISDLQERLASGKVK
jgi:phospholipid transport system substrate-binding protein